MKIAEINELAWNKVLIDMENVNFFQQTPWLDLVSKIFGLINRYIQVDTTEGEKIFICLQCNKNNEVYSNFIGYGGFLTYINISSQSLIKILAEIENKLNLKIVRIKLFPGNGIELISKTGWSVQKTSILKMGPNWHDKIKKETRNAISNAIKNDIEIKNLTPKDIDSFYDMYEKTMDRVDSSYKTPKLFFEKLIQFPNVYFVGAFHDKLLVATSIFLNQGDWSYYWWNASTEYGRKHNANYLIMFSTIKKLQEDNFKFIDMASSHNKGIVEFKNRWGSENEDFMIFEA